MTTTGEFWMTVDKDLETWLARSREACPDDDPIPTWVEEEFRRYLACGILAHGFARARCPGCGHDFLHAPPSTDSHGQSGETIRKSLLIYQHFSGNVVRAENKGLQVTGWFLVACQPFTIKKLIAHHRSPFRLSALR